jgi:hypothetical protein
MIVNLEVWLDLRFRDGRKQKWRSSAFADDYRTIQSVLEAYGAYRALPTLSRVPWNFGGGP